MPDPGPGEVPAEATALPPALLEFIEPPFRQALGAHVPERGTLAFGMSVVATSQAMASILPLSEVPPTTMALAP